MNNSLNGTDFRIGIFSPTLNYSKGAMLVRSIKVCDTNTKSKVDINVKSDNFGNIFYTGDKMRFNVEFDNSVAGYYVATTGAIPAEITYTLTDRHKNVCGQVVKEATIKPYQVFKDTVEFDVDKYDTYKIKAELRSDKKNIYSVSERECSYVKSSKGKIINEHAGISVPIMMNDYSGAEHNYSEEVAKIVRYAGYDLVRINLTTQQTAMSTYDHYTPNEIATHLTFGEQIQDIKNQGLKVMMYCTTFTRDNQKHTNALWYEKEGYVLPYTDEGRKRLLENELAILREHRGNIDVWEIGNETDKGNTFKNVLFTEGTKIVCSGAKIELIPSEMIGDYDYSNYYYYYQ